MPWLPDDQTFETTTGRQHWRKQCWRNWRDKAGGHLHRCNRSPNAVTPYSTHGSLHLCFPPDSPGHVCYEAHAREYSGSGDRTPTRARPPHGLPPPVQLSLDEAHVEGLKNACIDGHRLAVDAPGRVRVWTSGMPLQGAAMLALPEARVFHDEKRHTGDDCPLPRVPCAACGRRGHTPSLGSWSPRSHACVWCSCCAWRRA